MLIDTFALARTGGQSEGSIPLARFTRLLDGMPRQADDSRVAWKVFGESDSGGRMYLRLHVDANVTLVCQRCMEPLNYPITVDVLLEVVPSASHLTDEDETEVSLEDDAPDQIVGSHRFDVLELVEDELILAVPYVPRHEVCVTLPSGDVDPHDVQDQARPSPFAVLAGLKKT